MRVWLIDEDNMERHGPYTLAEIFGDTSDEKDVAFAKRELRVNGRAYLRGNHGYTRIDVATD